MLISLWRHKLILLVLKVIFPFRSTGRPIELTAQSAGSQQLKCYLNQLCWQNIVVYSDVKTLVICLLLSPFEVYLTHS